MKKKPGVFDDAILTLMTEALAGYRPPNSRAKYRAAIRVLRACDVKGEITVAGDQAEMSSYDDYLNICRAIIAARRLAEKGGK